MSPASASIEAYLSGTLTWSDLVERCSSDARNGPASRADWVRAIEEATARDGLDPQMRAALSTLLPERLEPRHEIPPGWTSSASPEATLLRVRPKADSAATVLRVPSGAQQPTVIRDRTRPRANPKAQPYEPPPAPGEPRPDAQSSPAPGELRSDPQPLTAPRELRPNPQPAPAPGQLRADPQPSAGLVLRGRYRLETLLGQGGMGQVWRARDLLLEQTHDPRPFVALKLLSPDFESHPDALVSLQREAGKAQALAHPNIATVFSFDLDPDSGRAFVTMQLLEGQTLDDLVRSAPHGLRRAEALPIIRGLATGLGYAHARSRGIVHSDFKPGNVFITEEGVPKILDFGIARVVRDARLANDDFDAASLSALTVSYASPEMLRGEEAHPSDDVYALGLLSYELLTGRHPFGRRPADEAARNKLSPARIKGLRPREWHAISRALAFERAARWPDAAAFLKAMEGISPWIPALSAVAVALAGVAGYSAYQNYLETKPAMPFDALTARAQEDFRRAMSEGDYAYEFGTKRLSGNEALSAIYRDALEQYSSAYLIHPRNADADAAMRRSLDFLAKKLPQSDEATRAEALAVLQSYQAQQPLSRYTPLQEAIDSLR